MRNRLLGKHWLVIIIVTVLVIVIVEPVGAVTNYAQQYALAQGMLYDLQDQDNLVNAQRMFEELGTYQQSKYYSQYVHAIRQLYEDQVDDALGIISVLSMLPGFEKELENNGLITCGLLATYARARQAEKAQHYSEAQELYLEAPILDSVDRLIAMNKDAEKLVAQWQTPSPISSSTQAPTDFSSPEAPVLRASNSKGGVLLEWTPTDVNAKYQLYWKRTKNEKDPFVLVAKTDSTSYLHVRDPHNGFRYSYCVKAILDADELTSNTVDIVFYANSNGSGENNGKKNNGGNVDPAPVWDETPASNNNDDWDSSFNINTPNPEYDEVVLPVWD